MFNNKVTLDYYNAFTGTNLNEELASMVSTNGVEASNVFIHQIESFVKKYFILHYSWDGELVNEHQEECFKNAICYQIMYELQNGSMWNDAGYNIQSGVVIDRPTLDKIGIAPECKNEMRLGGMANISRG